VRLLLRNECATAAGLIARECQSALITQLACRDDNGMTGRKHRYSMELGGAKELCGRNEFPAMVDRHASSFMLASCLSITVPRSQGWNNDQARIDTCTSRLGYALASRARGREFASPASTYKSLFV
jgi:hypothetical protein